MLLSELPEVLLEDIVDRLAEDTNKHLVRKACVALCLTCRATVEPAKRQLWREVQLEHSSRTSKAYTFRDTVLANPHLAQRVQSIRITSAIGDPSFAGRVKQSKELALLLQDTLAVCTNLRDIVYIPDDNARDQDEKYLAAWSRSSFESFTIQILRFKDLSLIPHHRAFKHLHVDVARDGDLQWDYDIFLPSWPASSGRTPVQADTVTLSNFVFPVWADEVMLDKLEQMCQAIAPPRHLVLNNCILSSSSIEKLLHEWGKLAFQSLTINRVAVLQENPQGEPIWHEEWPVPARSDGSQGSASLGTVRSFPCRFDDLADVRIGTLSYPCTIFYKEEV